MITIMVDVKVKPGKREEFLDTMRSLQNDRMSEKGLNGSKMYEDAENPDGFHLIDDWETDEDLARYRSGESFRIFLGALKTLCTETELNYGPFRRQTGDVSH